MAIILSIETSTEVCSVVLSRNKEILSIKETSGSNEHSAQLTLFIQEVAGIAGISLNAIDAIAVSMGPGSYTGLRIGVSAAKGLCYALDKPLIAVSTLKALAKKALMDFPEIGTKATLLCPMIDARRMEVFTAIYDLLLTEISPADAVILDELTFRPFSGQVIAVFGNGAAKCRELFQDLSTVIFPGPVLPSAVTIAQLAFEKYKSNSFENTAYFEPFYLKDFIAGKPKVKGLHG